MSCPPFRRGWDQGRRCVHAHAAARLHKGPGAKPGSQPAWMRLVGARRGWNARPGWSAGAGRAGILLAMRPLPDSHDLTPEQRRVAAVLLREAAAPAAALARLFTRRGHELA